MSSSILNRRSLLRMAASTSLVSLAPAALIGCAQTTRAQSSFGEVDSLDYGVAKVAETYDAGAYPQRTQPEDIELYYFLFHPLNSPDGLTNWRHHFVIAPPSTPSWSYNKLFKVVLPQRQRDDLPALAAIRGLAAARGGDAVIDLYRRAILSGRVLPAKVLAYEYEGVVVRKKA